MKSLDHGGYRLLVNDDDGIPRIIESRHVTFDESTFPGALTLVNFMDDDAYSDEIFETHSSHSEIECENDYSLEVSLQDDDDDDNYEDFPVLEELYKDSDDEYDDIGNDSDDDDEEYYEKLRIHTIRPLDVKIILTMLSKTVVTLLVIIVCFHLGSWKHPLSSKSTSQSP